MARKQFSGAVLFAIILGGCGPKPAPEHAKPPKPNAATAAPTPEPGEPPEPPLRGAFVGAQPRLSGPTLLARLESFGEFDGRSVVALVLPDDWRQRAFAAAFPDKGTRAILRPVTARLHATGAIVAFVRLQDSDATLEQLKSSAGPPAPADRLWLLTTPEHAQKLRLTLYANFDGDDPTSPALELPIQMEGSLTKSAGDARARFGRALLRWFEDARQTALGRFALHRLHELFGKSEGRSLAEPTSPSTPGPGVWGGPGGDQDNPVSELVSLTSGHRTVERALEYRSRLSPAQRSFRPTVPLAKLAAPTARQHDWATMLRGLAMSEPPPKLSESVPAEFYFVHAKSGEALFRLLEELDALLTPAMHLVEERSHRYDIAERYQTQLGLKQGPLSRALGPKAIEHVALVGSDPFLRMGSDVSIIFEAKNSELLALGLADSMSRVAEGEGEITRTQVSIAGRNAELATSRNRAVHRLFVREGNRFYVSNSQAALERILLTADGKHPALSGEADFRYMISRDAGTPADILVYAGDRFIEAVVAPRARILDGRRGLAHGELQRVSHAALLRGLFGAAVQADPTMLTQARFLLPHEARHFDGTRIDSGPVSVWGTPRHMVPLIELETPTRVTQAEADGYADFVRQYNLSWGETIDPIAVRLTFDDTGQNLALQLRVLPLVNDLDYRKLEGLVGDKRLELKQLGLGLYAVLGIAEDSELRRELTGASRSFLGQRLALDWVGDYAFVGVEDRTELANAAYSEVAPEPRDADDEARDGMADVPAYIGIAIKSRTGADFALTAAKRVVQKFDDAVPLDSVDHRGTRIDGVELTRSGFRIYYALGARTLFMALHERTLRRLIDKEFEGRLPEAREAGQTQFGVEAELSPGGGLATVVAWLFEGEAKDAGTALELADIARHALGPQTHSSPTLDLSPLSTLLGEVPVTQDGLPFHLAPEGPSDPHRGSVVWRRWPALPVAGSHLDAVLKRLGAARFEMAFDPEAPNRQGVRDRSLSIHVNVSKAKSTKSAPATR